MDEEERGSAAPAESAGRSRIGDVAATIAEGAGSVIAAARGPIDTLASGARRMINERPGARVRRVRRMGHAELANLWQLHPEARRAAIRELGIQSVPVDSIRGTAVEGGAQRGGDFLPLKERRSEDWRGRWQRILAALDRLEALPPVDLIKLGDEYWVVDGHNRVAAALYNGQVELDAVVQELRVPGVRGAPPSANLAPVLEGSRDLRAAGEGRLSRTAERPHDLTTGRHEHHANEQAAGEAGETDPE